MDIGIKVRKLRELKNFTQEYMAHRLNVSQATYSRLEKDDAYLTIAQLQKIAEILEIKVEDLINFTERYVFNNYDVEQANQGYNVINFSENERKLYEDKIRLLEEKIIDQKILIAQLQERN